MKNLIPILLLLFSGLHFVSAQDLQFSISAKVNHTFADVKASSDFQEIDLSSSFIQSEIGVGSIVGKTGFEIGAQVHLKLDDKIKIVSGLAFQQIQFEIQQNDLFGRFLVFENGEFFEQPSDVFVIDQFTGNLPFETNRIKNNVQVSYIKIPFLAEIDVVKDKVFFQLGFYGASLVSVKSPNSFLSPRFVDPLSSIVEVPNPKGQFTSLLIGLQSGIRVELIKQLSVQVDYSRSMNNLFDDDNLMQANMNNISAGLSWRFDI